jgi:hypothetical protein
MSSRSGSTAGQTRAEPRWLVVDAILVAAYIPVGDLETIDDR